MKALEFIAEVDAQHRLNLDLPDTPPGRVRVLVLLPESDADTEAGVTDAAWMQGVAREWNAELADVREDIYSLNDGEAIHAAG